MVKGNVLLKKIYIYRLFSIKNENLCKTMLNTLSAFLNKYRNIVQFYSFLIFFPFVMGSLSALSGEFVGLGFEANADLTGTLKIAFCLPNANPNNVCQIKKLSLIPK
jgi:hypothetical protein